MTKRGEMAAKEGFRRIKRISRVCIVIGALLLLSALVIALAGAKFSQSVNVHSAAIFLVPGLYLTVLGWLGDAICWIGEGFATRED